MEKQFLALVVREQADGSFTRSIDQRTIDDLPEGDVLVRVLYSSLNYKDALSASGNKGVTKTYPHTPGIDAAGVVEESRSADFQPGAEVLVSGYELGVSIPGGFGQFIRVPADRVMPRPEGLTLYESMVYGTAGFTAAASVAALIESGVSSGDGPVLVTGATGGVGSFAVALLAREGYEVVAATGKLEVSHPPGGVRSHSPAGAAGRGRASAAQEPLGGRGGHRRRGVPGRGHRRRSLPGDSDRLRQRGRG